MNKPIHEIKRDTMFWGASEQDAGWSSISRSNHSTVLTMQSTLSQLLPSIIPPEALEAGRVAATCKEKQSREPRLLTSSYRS